ncbi:MAG: NADH-dependent phenylglyoxylate dehydrogenase subunit epsilon [Syntrophobacteraceae bacterium]
MSQTKYLIVGASHAGLSALHAIRLYDREGSATMISAEKAYPYSPTILPYVVSGKVRQEDVCLRDQTYFDRLGTRFLNGSAVTAINPKKKSVVLDNGKKISYEKLLIATGAAPDVPPIAGLQECPHFVLRTIDDALEIRKAMHNAASAIVLGAGLIGVHAAENLAKAGLQVTLVARRTLLRRYFDHQAAAYIQDVFTQNGIRILTGSPITHVASSNGACGVSLENGLDLCAHILVVAMGVRPRTSFLEGANVKIDRGILVDDRMRTGTPDLWAAGDVAQAKGFHGADKILNGILPDAVEQGKIAGMDMAGDPSLSPWRGGIPMNTYSFFGNHAFSIGAIPDLAEEELEVHRLSSPVSGSFQEFVFKNDRLIRASGINTTLDPGILCRMIRNKVDLGQLKAKFAGAPLESGRVLMSGLWR